MNTNCKKQKDQPQIRLNKKDRKGKEFKDKNTMKKQKNLKDHEVSKRLLKIISQ